MTNDDLLDLGHRNMAAYYRESASWGRSGAALEEGGVVCYASSSSFPVTFNGVIRTDPRTTFDEVMDHASAFFGPRERKFTVWARADVDRDIVERLQREGLTPMTNPPEMILRERLADPDIAPGIEVRRAMTPEDVATFAALNGESYATYGLPPDVVPDSMNAPERFLAPHVYAVIARVEGEPAAGALAYLSHGIAGVYWVGTRPAYRGRGFGELVTCVVSNWAFDRGSRVSTLQASDMGEAIYRRMGYEEVYRYQGYLRV